MTPTNGRAGRPRNEPVAPTEFGRWLDETGWPIKEFVARFNELALEMAVAGDLQERATISKSSAYDLRRGQQMPSFAVMKVIKRLSDGEVDYEGWGVA